MKKRALCSLSLLLLLSGCGGNVSSPTDPPVTDTDVGTSETPFLTEESIPVSEESLPPVIDDWSPEVKEAFREVLGRDDLIPYVKGDSYTVSIQEDQGINYVDILLSGIRIETILEDYSDILRNEGFSVTQPSYDYLGGKELDLENNLYVQYNVIPKDTEKNTPDYFHVMAYKVQERTTIWPDELLYTMFFETLPSFPAKAYEPSYYFDTTKVTYVFNCYAHYTLENGYQTYKQTLIQNGFSIEEDRDYYTATSNTSNLNVVVYDYDSTQNLVFLKVTCNRLHFPNFMFDLLLGEEIPTIEISGCKYDYFFFDNSNGQLNNYTLEKYVPVLYIYNVEYADYDDYLKRLTAAGWNISPDGTYKKIINNVEHQLFLTYSETYKSIAIFVIK